MNRKQNATTCSNILNSSLIPAVWVSLCPASTLYCPWAQNSTMPHKEKWFSCFGVPIKSPDFTPIRFSTTSVSLALLGLTRRSENGDGKANRCDPLWLGAAKSCRWKNSTWARPRISAEPHSSSCVWMGTNPCSRFDMRWKDLYQKSRGWHINTSGCGDVCCPHTFGRVFL